MVDYSKWKKIEVSDDEDETHPNIDTPSLFKWRHEARLEREAEFKKKKQDLLDKVKKTEKEVQDAKKAYEGLTGKELDAAKKAALKIEKKYKTLLSEKADLEKEERLMPLNVDNLSKDGFQRTYLNLPKPKDTSMDHLTEEEKDKLQKEFLDKHESEIKAFGLLQKFDDSRRYLQERPHLVCNFTNNYLIIWCLNLEMEEKSDLAAHVAHQSTCMNYILELGKQLDVDPRSCVSSFFSRIQTADKVYKDAFDDELKALIKRVKNRAQEKIEAAMKEIEEEERQKRLGPGGLDPQEVFATLPEELQKCFESRDMELLKQVIVKMDEEDARYHMDRCVRSGLWVQDASAQAKAGDKDGESEAKAEGTETGAKEEKSTAAKEKEPTDVKKKVTSENDKPESAEVKNEGASKATDAAKGDHEV